MVDGETENTCRPLQQRWIPLLCDLCGTFFFPVGLIFPITMFNPLSDDERPHARFTSSSGGKKSQGKQSNMLAVGHAYALTCLKACMHTHKSFSSAFYTVIKLTLVLFYFFLKAWQRWATVAFPPLAPVDFICSSTARSSLTHFSCIIIKHTYMLTDIERQALVSCTISQRHDGVMHFYVGPRPLFK